MTLGNFDIYNVTFLNCFNFHFHINFCILVGGFY